MNTKTMKLSETGNNILSTQIEIGDLIEAFPRDKNVRDAEFGYRGPEDNLVTQLISIGHVVEPVLTAASPKDLKLAQFKKLNYDLQIKALKGVKGFRRSNIAFGIINNIGQLNPGFGEFSKMIPVRIEFGLTEKEIMDRKMDHGSIKSLNEWELVLCLRERFEKGESESAADTIYILRNLFDSHQSISQQKKLSDTLAKMDHLADPLADLNARKEIIRKHHYGRYQKLERIAKAKDQRLRDNFRAEIYNTGQALHITNEQYVKLYKLEGKEYEKAITEIKEERVRLAEVTKIKKWSKKDMETHIAVWGSEWIATLLKAVFGDEEAQKVVGSVAKKIKAAEDKIKEN